MSEEQAKYTPISPEQREDNRLTKRIINHVYYTMGAYSETLPAECTPQDVRQILKRLADYEDIGTLEEIKTLLSSEQAWKDKSEDQAYLIEKLREQESDLKCTAEALESTLLEKEREYDELKEESDYTHARLMEAESSVQAWRERAERTQNEWGYTIEDGETLKQQLESAQSRSARLIKKWKARVRLADKWEIRASRLEAQLKQAVEVLKKIAIFARERASCSIYLEQLADETESFLSSLSEEGDS